MAEREVSRARAFFAARPGLAARLRTVPEFLAWLECFPSITVDNEILHVVGGDMLRDDDEMLLQWAIEMGRLNPDEIP